MSVENTGPESAAKPAFTDLGLPDGLLKALSDVGYETPSPIQAATIPPLLAGRDVLGQAQTGTGKTAAFALPILARIDAQLAAPQALVLAPTRELAIQVAEAFQKYATHLPGFHVLPIYGGQSYTPQLQALRRGVQVVVGTPGRVIDHLERGSLDLSRLRALVLDEADEMLRMGFVDDVEAVVQKCPPQRQIALFSATMPPAIKRIAQTYLRDPVEVAIKATTTTGENIRQRYWLVSGLHKLDAITRILEAETYDAMIVFARTKLGTEELAEKLSARGIAAAAINGDMDQKSRERTIQRLKDGQLDVLVATDVAARGLDVERITHVLNYDIPYDTESYVHRIGRTGRAGRSGEAILFVTPRERGMLRAIERATRQPIEPMQLPTAQDVNQQRIGRFRDRISAALEGPDTALFRDLLEAYEREQNVPMAEIAAALAQMVQGDTPLFLPNDPPPPPPREARARPARGEEYAPKSHATEPGQRPPRPASGGPDPGMETFRIDVGYVHGVKPGNIVGAIANEAELESRYIGRVDIRTEYSLVDLPEGMPPELMQFMQNVRVAGRPIRLRPASAEDIEQRDERPRFERKPRPTGRDDRPRQPGFGRDGEGRPGGKPGFKKRAGFGKGGFSRPGSDKPRDPR